MNAAGFRLRALGRLTEATQSLQTALQASSGQNNWTEAARHACNISELYLTIGKVNDAITYAEQSIRFADQSGDESEQISGRTALGDALHQAGYLAEAQAQFNIAEEIQKKNQPMFPLLYSLQGYQYCDLLLSQGKHRGVKWRASQTLEWLNEFTSMQGSTTGLLDIALDNLSLWRAHIVSLQEISRGGMVTHLPRNDGSNLTHAVDGLRQAGVQEMLARGLLARAEYYRVMGELNKSQKDLDEAFSISTRGGMGLFLADCHLEYARLSLRAVATLAPHASAGEQLGTRWLLAMRGLLRRTPPCVRCREVRSSQ